MRTQKPIEFNLIPMICHGGGWPVCLLLLFLVACSSASGQWSHLGLSNTAIHELEIQQGLLYAATDSGLFRKPAATQDSVWLSLGFNQVPVYDVHVIDSLSLFAVIEVTGIASDTTTLMATNDGGSTWSPVLSVFEPVQQVYISGRVIGGPRQNADTLVMMGGGIWRSTNAGASFQLEDQIAGRFLAIAPGDPNIMWTGSEGPFLNPYLNATVDGGATWDLNGPLQQVVSGDNACLSGDIHPTLADKVYIGMEGQVIRSNDGGQNWSIILTSADYFKALRLSTTDPSIVYASGGRFGGTTLNLFISHNEGATWDTLMHQLPGGVVDPLSIAVLPDGVQDHVFIGTGGHGVWRYSTGPLGLEAGPHAAGSNYVIRPNPAREKAQVCPVGVAEPIHYVEVYDSSARLLHALNGIETACMDLPQDLHPGMYFVRVTTATGRHATLPFVIEQ